MRNEFKVHRLNAMGMAKAEAIAAIFSVCLTNLEEVLPPGRERALVVTKLQEAAFFAKKGISEHPFNQE